MADYLPPLNSLRAFEAAARHMSFAKAADELSVTPAALSFQIKSLEQHLGAPVFRRLNRAVELTELGRMLQPGVHDAFETLSASWRAARRRSSNGSALTVTAGPAFTAKWLAPRLFKFALANPDIELRFSASLQMMDFDRDEVDIAIRFGKTTDDNLFSESILEDWATPLMTPELAERFSTPADLVGAPLIHDDNIRILTPTADWPSWFLMAGVDWQGDGGTRFSHADHAIDAAIQGAGVVLGRGSIAEEALREGQLVAPFDLTLSVGGRYRIVCPAGTQDRPSVKRFRDWVADEMGSLRELTAARKPIPVEVWANVKGGE